MATPYLIIILYALVSERCYCTNGTEDWTPLVQELSLPNQLSLRNASGHLEIGALENPHGYEYFNPDMLDELIPRQARFWWWGDRLHKLNIDLEATDKGCFTLSTTWRRAKRDIKRYYYMRELYINTIEYEMGYLTHVIITKYMNMLELYEMISFRFIQHPDKLYAPPVYVWYIYTNLLEYSTSVIHHCNMMHELEKKYRKVLDLKGPWYSAEDHHGNFSDPEKQKQAARKKALEDYKKKLERERRQKRKMIKKMMKMQAKFGFTKSTPRTKRPNRHWTYKQNRLDYGWSIEDW